MSKRTFAIARAVAAIGGTAAIVSGVTFAALTSNTVTLSDNAISSATAAIKISNGGAYGLDATGVHITDFAPGTFSAPFKYYLQNNGGVDLDLSAKASSPATAAGFADFHDIIVVIGDKDGTIVETTTLGDLITGNVPVGTLAAGASGDANSTVPGNYTIQYKINPDKVSGSQVSVGAFTLTFSGTQHVPAP